jgi:hypothetical protein
MRNLLFGHVRLDAAVGLLDQGGSVRLADRRPRSRWPRPW